MVVVGGGGHAKVVIDLLRAGGVYQPIECTDPHRVGSDLLGVPIRGGDERLDALMAGGAGHAALAIGDNATRRRVGHELAARGFALPVLVHPAATVSPHARLGAGTVVMAGAVLNAGAEIGEVCIVNTGAVVEHDCRLEDGAHLACGAILAGSVRLGTEVLFGAGATAAPGAQVGARSVVGAGAVVIGTLPADVTATGVPARPRKPA